MTAPRPATQKPDALTPIIRQEYKDLGVKFIEPPRGFGCDFVVFHYRLDYLSVVFVEVKSKGEESRLTDAEKRLQRLAGGNFVIVTSLDHALAVAGWTL